MVWQLLPLERTGPLMPDIHLNPRKGLALAGIPLPADDAAPVADLLSRCPAHGPTPTRALPELAQAMGWAALWAKDERKRMGLGSFKALGAAYVIAREAEAGRAEGRVFACASAGNHGLSVAAGARAFGARAVIFLSDTVPEGFAARLRDLGAEVRRAGVDYEASMQAAEQAAAAEGFVLLSDSSWPGYTELPYRVMEGYVQLAAEMCAAPIAPTHLFLQAGVGGLAAAVAAHARKVWGDRVEITVVEPKAAPALIQSARAGAVVETSGPVSDMGRLDCKTPSAIALRGLMRDADRFMTISEADGAAAVAALSGVGVETTPSGAAGLAGAMALDLPQDAKVAVILSEGLDDA